MNKIRIAAVFFALTVYVNAQDSLKTINHEIGFNTVSLIKQIISNNPSNTLNQLPYDLFYNLYYKDKFGLRVGFGGNYNKTQTDITGQPIPRVTTVSEIDLRVGGSWNFVHYKRVTLNAFVDFVTSKNKMQTSSTTTTQSFPNPVTITSVESKDQTIGNGAQVGVGLKFDVYKHLSLYAEMPVRLLMQKTTSNVVIVDDGVSDISNSSIKTTNIQTFVPTTIYLVLKF